MEELDYGGYLISLTMEDIIIDYGGYGIISLTIISSYGGYG